MESSEYSVSEGIKDIEVDMNKVSVNDNDKVEQMEEYINNNADDNNLERFSADNHHNDNHGDDHNDNHNIEMDEDIYNFVPNSNVQMMEINGFKTPMLVAIGSSSKNISEDLLTDRPDDTRVMTPFDEEEINLRCDEISTDTEDDFH